MSSLSRSTYFAAADGVMSVVDTFATRDAGESTTFGEVIAILQTAAELMEMEGAAEGSSDVSRVNKSGRSKIRCLVRRRDYLRTIEDEGRANSRDRAEASALSWALERMGFEQQDAEDNA